MYVLKQKPQQNKDDGWYIAPWSGDPARTLKFENAKMYKSISSAKKARTFYETRFSHIRKIDLEIIDYEDVSNGRA